jgi:SHS2 domain-containing protein
MPRWEHFSHDADVGVRGYGATREQAFEQAALALTAVVTEPRRVRLAERVELRCSMPASGTDEDLDYLFLEWMNQVIYEMDTRKMVFGRLEVTRVDVGVAVGTEAIVSGSAWGERVEPERHEPAVYVKGATLTALRVAWDGDEWVAQCVVDV